MWFTPLLQGGAQQQASAVGDGFRSLSFAGASFDSFITGSLPTGAQPGDLLIAFLGIRSALSQASVVAPTGWTEIVLPGNTDQYSRFKVYKADGSVTNFQWTGMQNNFGGAHLVIAAFEGRSGDVLGAACVTTTTTIPSPFPAPSVPASAGDTAIRIFCNASSTGSFSGVPSPDTYTTRYNSYAPGLWAPFVLMQTARVTTSGSTAPATAQDVSASGELIGIQIILRAPRITFTKHHATTPSGTTHSVVIPPLQPDKLLILWIKTDSSSANLNPVSDSEGGSYSLVSYATGNSVWRRTTPGNGTSFTVSWALSPDPTSCRFIAFYFTGVDTASENFITTTSGFVTSPNAQFSVGFNYANSFVLAHLEMFQGLGDPTLVARAPAKSFEFEADSLSQFIYLSDSLAAQNHQFTSEPIQTANEFRAFVLRPAPSLPYRPVADVTTTGWSSSTPAVLFDMVDELSASDSDYIISPPLVGSGATYVSVNQYLSSPPSAPYNNTFFVSNTAGSTLILVARFAGYNFLGPTDPGSSWVADKTYGAPPNGVIGIFRRVQKTTGASVNVTITSDTAWSANMFQFSGLSSDQNVVLYSAYDSYRSNTSSPSLNVFHPDNGVALVAIAPESGMVFNTNDTTLWTLSQLFGPQGTGAYVAFAPSDSIASIGPAGGRQLTLTGSTTNYAFAVATYRAQTYTPEPVSFKLDNLPQGFYAFKVRARKTGPIARVRVRLHGIGGSQVGISTDELMTSDFEVLSLNVQTSSVATRLTIEVSE